MTFFKTFGAIAAASFLIGVPSAEAQHRGGGGHARPSGGGQSGSSRVAVPRSFGAPRGGAPRVYGSSRAMTIAPRSYSYGTSRLYAARPHGGAVGRAMPRVIGSRVVPYRYDRPSYRYYRPSPYRFYRPYYAFRPRLSLGFGLWVGFPIAYSYGYYDPYYSPYGYPYGYSYPYPYPAYAYPYPAATYPAYLPSSYPPAYPPSAYPSSPYPQPAYPPASGSVGVQPGQADTGGVSFEITPSTAEVFVDGSFVGTVGEFTPTTQPLGMAAGRHHIEIRAAGYRTMALDVDIVAGQVIPYRGELQR